MKFGWVTKKVIKQNVPGGTVSPPPPPLPVWLGLNNEVDDNVKKENVSLSSPTKTLPNGNWGRNSRSQMFFKTAVCEYFAHFTGKHLCWSLILIKIIKSIKRRLQHICFPVKSKRFLRTSFFSQKHVSQLLLLVRIY